MNKEHAYVQVKTSQVDLSRIFYECKNVGDSRRTNWFLSFVNLFQHAKHIYFREYYFIERWHELCGYGCGWGRKENSMFKLMISENRFFTNNIYKYVLLFIVSLNIHMEYGIWRMAIYVYKCCIFLNRVYMRKRKAGSELYARLPQRWN